MKQDKLNEVKSCYEQRGYVWNDDAGWLIAELERALLSPEETKLLRLWAGSLEGYLHRVKVEPESSHLKDLVKWLMDYTA